MGSEDAIRRWNETYLRGEETYGFEPTALLRKAVAGVTPGKALDVACGAGRHALFLAGEGWQVTAVDAAQEGVEVLKREAGRRGLGERISTAVADLRSMPCPFVIQPESFDLVVCFYFLERALFDHMRQAVRPGGLFVGAMHVESAGNHDGRHGLLRAGELKTLVGEWGWDIVMAREGPSVEAGHDHADAEIIARPPLRGTPIACS